MSLKEEKPAKSTELRKTLSKLGLNINAKNPSLTLKKFIQIYTRLLSLNLISFAKILKISLFRIFIDCQKMQSSMNPINTEYNENCNILATNMKTRNKSLIQ
jgi:hypothetical protein